MFPCAGSNVSPRCARARRRAGHTYGKLAPQAINSAAAAEGEANFGTADKRDASDFALWKAAKPGEPAWPSPECARGADGQPGSGRPGVCACPAHCG